MLYPLNHKTTIPCCLALLGALLLPPPSALAQSDEDLQLEEIVVTSQRRAESLQEVPIAISALSQFSLEKTDTHDLGTLAVQVPGLTFSPFSPGQNIVSLRGAASNDDGAGTDGSVAVFVDEVYLGRVSNINPEMFDLERIEVLRGPQGTLYGRNTIGGAINVISTRPNTEELSGKVKVALGDYNRQDVAALVSGPLGGNWAGKVAVTSRVRDGWVNNPVLNKDQKDDNATGFRAQLLHEGDGFEALLSFDSNELDVEDMARTPATAGYNGNEGGPNPATFRGAYDTVCGTADRSDCAGGAIDGYARREASGFSGKFIWDMDEQSQLIYIVASRSSEADWQMDSAGSTALSLVDNIEDTTDQTSHEVRWVSSTDNLKYVAGLWLLNEETDRAECFDLSITTDCTNSPTTDGADYYRQMNQTDSFAVFGQADWALSDDLTLSVGGRFSQDEKTINNTSIQGNFVIINSTFTNTVSENWNAFTPKFSINWASSERVNLYATLAQGFKSGGFGAAPYQEVDTRPVDQEDAQNIEFGFKSRLRDNFQLNIAYYTTEYEGLQIQSFGARPDCEVPDPENPPLCNFGAFITHNAGDASISGVEVEFNWQASSKLYLQGFISTADSEFGTTNITNSNFSNQAGQRMIRTPEMKYALSLEYDVPMSNGSRFAFGFNYSFTGDQRAELAPYAIQPEFDLLDVRAAWTNAKDNLDITLWVKNAADTEWISHIYTIAGSVTAVYGDPQMTGVTGVFKF